jgi:hypothetical protein
MALKGRRSTPEERLRAVHLLKEGNEAALVAKMFDISRAMLFGGSRNMTRVARSPWRPRDSSPDLSSGLKAGARSVAGCVLGLDLVSGYDSGPADGPGDRGSTVLDSPSLLVGTGSCWSRCLRKRADPLPGGGNRLGPGPGCGDFQPSPPPAAHEPGGCVRHAVAQRFRFCFREVAVQGQPASSARKAGRRFRGSCVTRPGSSLWA